ncbi:MAG: NifB/NifX family molybdenum-iron cluster-binding protein [Deltaproteobacteria bacterium]|nr:NifB/NifX family molybdenum-iron cluster-binding protein [Deltaproteobacteria bacterium]
MTDKKTIAISSDDDRGLDALVNAHFGRCPHFTLVRVDGGEVLEVEVVENPHFKRHRPGEVPSFVHDLGADIVLSGGMGPRAVSLFHSHGIDVATGASGTVGEVLRAYLDGTLSGIVPCAHDHPESCGKGSHPA